MRRQATQRLVLASFVMAALTFLSSVTGCSRNPNIRKRKYLESGERYMAKGKLQEAAIQFSNALKVDHGYAAAHYQLAHTYIKEGMLQAGYVELIHTVDLAPSNIQARLDLGNLALAGGDLARATEQARALLPVPTSPRISTGTLDSASSAAWPRSLRMIGLVPIK